MSNLVACLWSLYFIALDFSCVAGELSLISDVWCVISLAIFSWSEHLLSI
ncbi:hypothetical protein B296_00057812 [Ensete ventricosum]|uniref:Uncharacterized protein n=1 Tax=Ensete ventricosum TaxID=4639 RepID=A0A426X257_ENSVE|nr:hypothetical protein B296_00057812 [Ensete ventricosum]